MRLIHETIHIHVHEHGVIIDFIHCQFLAQVCIELRALLILIYVVDHHHGSIGTKNQPYYIQQIKNVPGGRFSQARLPADDDLKHINKRRKRN